MPNEPYPGYPPSFKIVDETKGLARTCLVIEFLSDQPLALEQLSFLRDQIDGLLERLQTSSNLFEEAKSIIPQQFDTMLRQGLRIS